MKNLTGYINDRVAKASDYDNTIISGTDIWDRVEDQVKNPIEITSIMQ